MPLFFINGNPPGLRVCVVANWAPLYGITMNVQWREAERSHQMTGWWEIPQILGSYNGSGTRVKSLAHIPRQPEVGRAFEIPTRIWMGDKTWQWSVDWRWTHRGHNRQIVDWAKMIVCNASPIYIRNHVTVHRKLDSSLERYERLPSVLSTQLENGAFRYAFMCLSVCLDGFGMGLRGFPIEKKKQPQSIPFL